MAAAPTATSTTSPVTYLVRDFKTEIINAAQPVYDIKNDRYDTPNLGAQVNARYLYQGDLPEDLLDDTARAVIDTRPDATGIDVAVAIGHVGPSTSYYKSFSGSLEQEENGKRSTKR